MKKMNLKTSRILGVCSMVFACVLLLGLSYLLFAADAPQCDTCGKTITSDYYVTLAGNNCLDCGPDDGLFADDTPISYSLAPVYFAMGISVVLSVIGAVAVQIVITKQHKAGKIPA